MNWLQSRSLLQYRVNLQTKHKPSLNTKIILKERSIGSITFMCFEYKVKLLLVKDDWSPWLFVKREKYELSNLNVDTFDHLSYTASVDKIFTMTMERLTLISI